MFSTLRLVALASVLASASLACGGAPDDATDAVGESDDALRMPRGHFRVERAPSSGSYIAALTLKAGKAFELEYVRVTSRSEPWLWNPFLSVPVKKTESFLLTGKYFTYAGDPGQTMISFDVSEGSIDHLSYAIEVVDGALRLTAPGGASVGGNSFTLEPAEAEAPQVDKRVVSCDGRRFKARITFEDTARRRGSMVVTRKAGADDGDPKNGQTTIVTNGSTGVDDYLGFEGEDSAGGRYEFALKRSDLARTSGDIAQVGLGYSAPNRPYFVHNTLDCSIATR